MCMYRQTPSKTFDTLMHFGIADFEFDDLVFLELAFLEWEF